MKVNPPYMFGMAFVRPDDEAHVHAKYTATCKTDCHFMIIDRRHLNTIQERIIKKQQKEEIQLMKKIKQLQGCSNKIITKLQSYRKIMTVQRNQYLFKEGDDANKVYIIKNGQFLMTKSIKEKKGQNIEHDLLLK